MKILIAHNDYGRRSGEEAVVDQMELMFSSRGHTVCSYRPSTVDQQAGIGNKFRVFLSGVYSLSGVEGMRKMIKDVRPDIVNIHNLFPFISPAALFACSEAGVPVVMTVHNYRRICPTGLFLRDGRPCEYCLEQGHEWGCVKFNCEKNLGKSMGYALRGTVARKMGAYEKNVRRFVCLTEFQRRKLVEAGFCEEKIAVIPNSITTLTTSRQSGDYVAYVGRLSEEKGWDLLVEVARKNPSLRIEVAGEGEGGANWPDNIRFRGFLDPEGLAGFYRGARFIVIPSRCYEGFPVVALEAMALGKPVVAPDHGGFTEIVGQGGYAAGRLFRANDVVDLESVILDLWEDEQLVRVLGRRAMEKVRAHYAADTIYLKWEELFTAILNNRAI